MTNIALTQRCCMCVVENDKMELILSEWLTLRVMLAVGAILCATYLLYRRRNGHKLPPGLKWAPGFPNLPIIGSLPWMTADSRAVADFSVSPKNKFGKIWSFYLGPKYDFSFVYSNY